MSAQVNTHCGEREDEGRRETWDRDLFFGQERRVDSFLDSKRADVRARTVSTYIRPIMLCLLWRTESTNCGVLHTRPQATVSFPDTP